MTDNRKNPKNLPPGTGQDYSRHAAYVRIGKWFVFAVREHRSLIVLLAILGLAFAFTLETLGDVKLPEGSN